MSFTVKARNENVSLTYTGVKNVDAKISEVLLKYGVCAFSVKAEGK